jgi:hypothetical protein
MKTLTIKIEEDLYRKIFKFVKETDPDYGGDGNITQKEVEEFIVAELESWFIYFI